MPKIIGNTYYRVLDLLRSSQSPMKIDLLSASALGFFRFNLSVSHRQIIWSLIIKGYGHNETESLKSLVVSSPKASQLELWKIFNLLKCNISPNLVGWCSQLLLGIARQAAKSNMKDCWSFTYCFSREVYSLF